MGSLALTGCDWVDELVEDESSEETTLALEPARRTVPIKGSTAVVVRGQRRDGKPVQDGTEVTLRASMGSLEPSTVTTQEGRASATYRAGDKAGTERLQAAAGKATTEAELTIEAAPPASSPGSPSPAPAPSSGALDLRQVVWLHTDVSRWPETSRITEVEIRDPPICIRHTKAGRWPVVNGVEGNPWVFANINGRWYAGTYEWLRSGQVCKGISAATIGPHVKREPLASWRPRSGELVGFMVSTHARAGAPSIKERSNVVLVRWP